MTVLSIKGAVSEFIAMAFYVYVGCAAMVFNSAPPNFDYSLASVLTDLARMPSNNPAEGSIKSSFISSLFNGSGSSVVVVALAFSASYTCLMFIFGRIAGGGHINSSISLAYYILDRIPLMQLLMNWTAQFLGSLLGACLVYITVPAPIESNLGANVISNGVGVFNAVAGEVVMTFIFVFTVLSSTLNGKQSKDFVGLFAPIVCGLALFGCHLVLGKLDGCSVNTARYLGPALISGALDNWWVFLFGPACGSCLASMAYMLFEYPEESLKRMFSTFRLSSSNLYSAQTVPTSFDSRRNSTAAPLPNSSEALAVISNSIVLDIEDSNNKL